jgi:hypothetical protein
MADAVSVQVSHVHASAERQGPLAPSRKRFSSASLTTSRLDVANVPHQLLKYHVSVNTSDI